LTQVDLPGVLIMSPFSFLAPVATPLALQAAGGRDMLVSMAPILIMFGIFYVLLILPMRKRQKALQQTIEGLKKGDKVLTTGGLYGEVAAVEEGSLLLKIADNVKVRVAKSAIAGLEASEADKGSK
jgi:preprotein translocase subunit YajC